MSEKKSIKIKTTAGGVRSSIVAGNLTGVHIQQGSSRCVFGGGSVAMQVVNGNTVTGNASISQFAPAHRKRRAADAPDDADVEETDQYFVGVNHGHVGPSGAAKRSRPADGAEKVQVTACGQTITLGRGTLSVSGGSRRMRHACTVRVGDIPIRISLPEGVEGVGVTFPGGEETWLSQPKNT